MKIAPAGPGDDVDHAAAALGKLGRGKGSDDPKLLHRFQRRGHGNRERILVGVERAVEQVAVGIRAGAVNRRIEDHRAADRLHVVDVVVDVSAEIAGHGPRTQRDQRDDVAPQQGEAGERRILGPKTDRGIAGFERRYGACDGDRLRRAARSEFKVQAASLADGKHHAGDDHRAEAVFLRRHGIGSGTKVAQQIEAVRSAERGLGESRGLVGRGDADAGRHRRGRVADHAGENAGCHLSPGGCYSGGEQQQDAQHDGSLQQRVQQREGRREIGVSEQARPGFDKRLQGAAMLAKDAFLVTRQVRQQPAQGFLARHGG